MTEMPNSGFATEVECLANHTTGSSLHLGSHVGHPGGLCFRHRLQRVAGFAWVSYVIMLAAEELLRLARATKSEKQAQKFHGAKPRKPSCTYKVLKKFICLSTSAPWGKTQDKPRQPGLASRSRRRLLARPSGAREPSSKSKMQ